VLRTTRRCASRPRAFAAVVASVALAGAPHDARADEPRPGDAHAGDEPLDRQLVDGAAACNAFNEKNEQELSLWEKTQPSVPYAYPRETTFLNAPWSRFFSNLGRAGELFLATAIPHVGAQFRGDAPAAHVAWPWTILVFGPMYSCSRKFNTFVVHGHRAHRVLLEPAVVSSKLGVGFSVRPGYRFVWHPSTWVVGPGFGLGTTVEVAGNQEPFRYSIGPEVLAHFGNCCSSSYFTFAVRFDHFFAGMNRDIVGGSLGYTFF
jgi:hypothetical protein